MYLIIALSYNEVVIKCSLFEPFITKFKTLGIKLYDVLEITNCIVIKDSKYNWGIIPYSIIIGKDSPSTTFNYKDTYLAKNFNYNSLKFQNDLISLATGQINIKGKVLKINKDQHPLIIIIGDKTATKEIKIYRNNFTKTYSNEINKINTGKIIGIIGLYRKFDSFGTEIISAINEFLIINYN